MKNSIVLKLAPLFVSLPLIGFAHSGHGVMDGASMIHYLLSPLHAIPAAFIIIGLALYFFRKRRAASRQDS